MVKMLLGSRGTCKIYLFMYSLTFYNLFKKLKKVTPYKTTA